MSDIFFETVLATVSAKKNVVLFTQSEAFFFLLSFFK